MDHGQRQLLEQTAGPLWPYFEDKSVIEVMVNPDGSVFVERFGQGMKQESSVEPGGVDAFLRVVASLVGAEWRHTSPSLHAALRGMGWRLQAERQPIADGPMFTMRKHPAHVFPLDDFVEKGILTPKQRKLLMQYVLAKKSVLVSGATGSAKTSIINAMLHELGETDWRVLILEDDPELLCPARNTASLHTEDGANGGARVTMADLVKKAMRHRPDLLVIGEVRDGAALDMLKAWQTGHSGLGSVHAESAKGTLMRMEQLVQEVSATPQKELIAEAIDLICHMERHGRSWRCTNILACDGLDAAGEYITRQLA